MKHTRKLALLLTLIMLSQSIALTGCSDNTTTETGGSTTTAQTESSTTSDTANETDGETAPETTDGLIGIETNYDWKAGVKKADYEGYTYNILNGNTATWYSYTLVTSEETTGEPVNDAIYERTQRTNEFLNVNVVESNINNSHEELKKAVQAGTKDYDLALCYLMTDYALAVEGNVLELNSEVPGLDMSGAWWDQNSINDLSINNKLYFVTSDFDTTRFDSIRSLYFNKQLFENYGLEDPYEIVDSGKWTIDKFIELAEKGVSDADGDGVMTDMDNYGYICYGELAADLLFRGAGVKYVDKDPETGRLIDGTSGEKTVDVYSKIYRLLWGGNTTFDIRQSRFSSYLRGKGDRIQEELFTEGRILFYSECMAWTRVLREMEADFGVLPPPKYDEAQDRYYSVMLNPYMQMIPVTVEDPERSGHVLDVLAAASHDTVVDAYVNVTLSGKVARDADTVRMLRLVFDDLSYNIHFAKIPTRTTIQSCVSGGKENLTSALKATSKVITKILDVTNADFFD